MHRFNPGGTIEVKETMNKLPVAPATPAKWPAAVPLVMGLRPDVLVVTGDHSTPAALASHSWHPVPVLLYADTCRPDRVERFGERDCIQGGLGRMPMVHLMGQALAHAKRLEKFGA